MKTINLLLVTLSLFASAANGSVLAILTTKQPLYLAGSGGGDEILIRDVQVVSLHADPEATFSAIVVPYTPPSDGSWKQPGNVNIAALAGIEIHCKHLDGRLTEVIIAADAAKTPKNLPFGIDEIIDATRRCVEKVAREKGLKIAIKVDKPTKSKGDGASPK
jgi:hypothetical protein